MYHTIFGSVMGIHSYLSHQLWKMLDIVIIVRNDDKIVDCKYLTVFLVHTAAPQSA
jgi:hypothetical protein